MDTFLFIVRILMMIAASVIAVTYLIAQMWQRVPQMPLGFKFYDYIVYGIVGFAFGLGLNNHWALLSFAPLLLAKIVSHFSISKNRVIGSGRWMEIQWQRFTPRGFKMPQEAMQQIGRLPSDAHFVIPRFVSLIAVKMFMKTVRKNMGKAPTTMRGQETQAMDMVEGIARNILRLDKGRTEKLSLPFGELKVTRL